MGATPLDEAWPRVRELVERAAALDAWEGEGGEVFGWFPAKPGEEPLDDDCRTLWLSHRLFRPLTAKELAELERGFGRELPGELRTFYRECANGLDLAAGGVTIYGLQRGEAHDPYDLALEGIETPDDGDPSQFVFGSWGGDGNALYLDERDGSVHVAGLESMAPLRSWPSLGEFLVAALEEHLEVFDAEGRRTGEVGLPPETGERPARPPSAPPSVPGHEQAVEQLVEALCGAPEEVAVGDATYVLAAADALGDEQEGYAGDDWRASWVVIGRDEDLGDPLFVDVAEARLPVYTAQHAAGEWEPEEVASSLDDLLGRAPS